MVWAYSFGRMFWAYVLSVCFGRMFWAYVLGVCFGLIIFWMYSVCLGSDRMV
jgi:hypothetical protein